MLTILTQSPRIYPLIAKGIRNSVKRLQLPLEDLACWKRLAAWAPEDRPSCYHLMRALTTEGDANRTSAFLRHLAVYELPPRAEAHAALIWLSLRAEDQAAAQQEVREMNSQEDSGFLSALVGAACITNQPVLALRVIELLEQESRARAAVTDLERIFHGAIGISDLPLARQTLTLLKNRGAAEDNIHRWQLELNDAEVFEQVSSSTNKRPFKKYVILKSAITNKKSEPTSPEI